MTKEEYKKIKKDLIESMIDFPIVNEVLAIMKKYIKEPKTGHWVECMPGGAEEWCYKCSECNFWKYKKSINLSKFKFCPNCGARMSEKKEDN